MKKVKNPRKDMFDNESPIYRFQISIIASKDVEKAVERLFKTNFMDQFYNENYFTTMGVEPLFNFFFFL